MGQMLIAAIAIVFAVILVFLRTVFIQNELLRPVEAKGGPGLRWLRIAFYSFFYGGCLLAISGSFAQSYWLRETGLWIWAASAPIFIARHVELRRRLRKSRRHKSVTGE
jgi:hypothetical protein